MIVYLNHFRILDDFGHELEMTDSKLQQTVLKVEKVLRLSDGRRLVFCCNSLKPLLLMTTTTVFRKPLFIVLLLSGG